MVDCIAQPATFLPTPRQLMGRVALRKPDSSDAWLAQGYYLYRGLQDRPGALQAFAKAVAREPNNVDALSAMAFVERRLGALPQALAHIDQVLAIDPGNSNFLAMRGEILAALRRYPEAHATYDRALHLQPGDVGTLAKKALSFQAEGDLVGAQRVLDGIPIDSEVYPLEFARPQQAWLRGQPDRLVAHCAALLTAGPAANVSDAFNRIDCQLDSAEAQRALGQSAAALAGCKSALARLQQPDISVLEEFAVQFARGRAHACLGDKPEALRELRRAIELLGGDAKETPGVELVLARAYLQFGDKDAALAILKRSLAVPYGTTTALLRLDARWAPLRGDARFQALLRGR